MSSPSELPRDLPRTLSLFAALPFVAFGVAATVTEILAGTGRSTSSVGYMLLPLVAAALGLAAYVVGLLIRVAWQWFGWPGSGSPTLERTLMRSLGLTCGAAAIAGIVGSLMQ